MKNKIFIIIILSIISYSNLFSQVSQQWVATYNGGNANSITLDVAGNVYVTGHFTTGNQGYGTIKYNSNGVQQWANSYRYVLGDNEAYSIAADNSGDVFVTGRVVDGSNVTRVSTVKYDSFGNQQWTNIIYDRMLKGGSTIAADAAGNIYISAFYVAGGGSVSYQTIKYNSSGTMMWDQSYAGFATALALDAEGHIYVTGFGPSNSAPNSFATIKYDSNGNQLWASRYYGLTNSVNKPISIVVDNSSNVYVTGYGSGVAGDSDYDYITLKYDSSGNEQWASRYDGPGHSTDLANSIAVDNSGNVYATGFSRGIETSRDYATIKYNSTGIQQWVQRYNGSGNGNDMATMLKLDVSGNIYVTGSSQENGTGYDYVTIKYSPSGAQQWIMSYNDSANGNDFASSIAVDGSGNVFVTGTSGTQYGTVKYSQLLGINPISTEIPKEYNLYQNYPNPFNPTTKIKFNIPSGSSARLVIYDAVGREIAKLVNEQLKPGSYEVVWDATNFPSGVYFYKLISGSYIQTKKLVLIK